MRSVSAQYKAALNVSHKNTTTVTCTTPLGVEVDLQISGGGVSSSADSGARYQARIDVLPQPGVDLYSILSTPGALFDIDHGIDFGGGSVELVDYGVYEAASGGINIIEGSISLSLVDQWQRIERCRFSEPYTPPSGIWSTRAQYITDALTNSFTGAIPDAAVLVYDDGGTWTPTPDRVWDRDRTQFIRDIATDGGLDVFFNAAGQFVIRKEPIVDPTASVWTFRTGEFGNIETADRERPFDRLYNRVVINPIDENQTWTPSTFDITDTANSRHSDYIGVVPYFYSSPTLLTQAAVNNAGETLLQRIQGTTETLSLGTLGAPLEVGDTVTVIHPPTDSDPGFNAIHIIEGWDYDLVSGTMTCKTRSSELAELEES
jgi:hypothetical protein